MINVHNLFFLSIVLSMRFLFTFSDFPFQCTMSCSNGESTEVTPCVPEPRTYAEGEIESIVESIRKELTIEKKKTKKYQNSLISAPDDRFSAKTMGYAGAVILIVLTTIVVLMDLPALVNGLRNQMIRFRDWNIQFNPFDNKITTTLVCKLSVPRSLSSKTVDVTVQILWFIFKRRSVFIIWIIFDFPMEDTFHQLPLWNYRFSV